MSANLTTTRLGLIRRTIVEVIEKHHLHRDDFFGPSREPHLVAARREAAKRLDEAGFSASQIGRHLKREYTTILNYLPKLAENKKARRAARLVTRRLSVEAANFVADAAKTLGVPQEQLIAEWVEQRFKFEMQRKVAA